MQFDFIKDTSKDKYHHPNTVVINKNVSLEDLEKYIKYHMTNIGRCLTIKCDEENGVDYSDTFQRLHKLSAKYKPWQFRTLVNYLNDDKSKGIVFDIDWTEVQEWIEEKYK